MIALTDRSAMLLSEFFETVYCKYRLIDCSARSLEPMLVAISRFAKFLDRQPTLGDLTVERLTEFMTDCKAGGNSAETSNNKTKSLARLWRFAIRKRYLPSIDETPAEMEYLKQFRRLPKAWSIEQVAQILATCRKMPGNVVGIPIGKFFAALVLVLFDCGLRRQAALAIRIDEIDFETKTLNVPAESMKNSVEQVFYLSDQTVAAILDTIPPQRPLLFPWPYADARKTLANKYREILKRAGLPFGKRDLFHKLRRTCSTHITAVAGEAAAIAQLGHGDARTIKRYNDPRFLNSHDMTKLLPRPGWDGRKVTVEEKDANEAGGPKPLIVRLTRAELKGETDVLAPMRDRDNFTAADLSAALEHLGIGPPQFARELGMSRATLWNVLTGKRPITLLMRKRIRASLGFNYVTPKGGVA